MQGTHFCDILCDWTIVSKESYSDEISTGSSTVHILLGHAAAAAARQQIENSAKVLRVWMKQQQQFEMKLVFQEIGYRSSGTNKSYIYSQHSVKRMTI